MKSIKLEDLKIIVATLYEKEDELKVDMQDVYAACLQVVSQQNIHRLNDIKPLYDYLIYGIKDCNINSLKEKVKKLIKSKGLTLNDFYYHALQILGFVKMDDKHKINEFITARNILLMCYSEFVIYCGEICCKLVIKNAGGRGYKEEDLLNLKMCLNNATKPLIEALENTVGKINIGKVHLGKTTVLNAMMNLSLVYDLLDKVLPIESGFYKGLINPYNSLPFTLLKELGEKEFAQVGHEDFWNAIRQRKFLLPYNGIHAIAKLHEFDLWERQYNNDNYLIVIMRPSGVTQITLFNLTKEVIITDSCSLYDQMMLLMNFYELDDYIKDNFNLYYSIEWCNIKGKGGTIRGFNTETYKIQDIEIPYYWKYRGTKTESSYKTTFKKQVLEDKDRPEIYISAFKRRLPAGQKASEKAKNMAKYYCIELKDNETLVEPFVRKSR